MSVAYSGLFARCQSTVGNIESGDNASLILSEIPPARQQVISARTVPACASNLNTTWLTSGTMGTVIDHLNDETLQANEPRRVRNVIV